MGWWGWRKPSHRLGANKNHSNRFGGAASRCNNIARGLACEMSHLSSPAAQLSKALQVRSMASKKCMLQCEALKAITPTSTHRANGLLVRPCLTSVDVSRQQDAASRCCPMPGACWTLHAGMCPLSCSETGRAPGKDQAAWGASEAVAAANGPKGRAVCAAYFARCGAAV